MYRATTGSCVSQAGLCSLQIATSPGTPYANGLAVSIRTFSSDPGE